MINNYANMERTLNFNLWFIKLRWIASVVALILVLVTVKFLHYLSDRNLYILFFLIIVLLTANTFYYFIVRKNIRLRFFTEIQIVVDLIILTVMLHYSGGIENPLSFLYLFHVILSGILLSKKKSYLTVVLAFALYFSLASCELYEYIPHYTLNIFPHQTDHMEVNADQSVHSGHEEDVHASHYEPYVWSLSALNLFVMLLTAYFITNIMERLRTEKTKTNLERQRLEKVLQSTHTGLVIVEKDLRINWYNEPAAALLELEKFEPDKLKSTINEWIKLHEDKIFKTFSDAKRRSVEKEYIDRKGEKQYFQITIAPLFDPEGEVHQVVELIQNVSIRKYLETEMIHSAKMVTLGTMAAGIAHEVGNPLASISTRLELLSQNTDADFISKSIELLKKEISRIDRIVRGISQFGRAGKDEWKICDINMILNDTVEMLQYHKSSKNVEIIKSYAGNLPITRAVPDQMKQVFLNVGLNALEAMPGGGKLTVTTAHQMGQIKISFTDTGSGLEERQMKKIFHPFFTTKSDGSGLGLFIVNHIIEAHGGKITVKTEPGAGSEFTIFLPIFIKQNDIN